MGTATFTAHAGSSADEFDRSTGTIRACGYFNGSSSYATSGEATAGGASAAAAADFHRDGGEIIGEPSATSADGTTIYVFQAASFLWIAYVLSTGAEVASTTDLSTAAKRADLTIAIRR